MRVRGLCRVQLQPPTPGSLSSEAVRKHTGGTAGRPRSPRLTGHVHQRASERTAAEPSGWVVTEQSILGVWAQPRLRFQSHPAPAKCQQKSTNLHWPLQSERGRMSHPLHCRAAWPPNQKQQQKPSCFRLCPHSQGKLSAWDPTPTRAHSLTSLKRLSPSAGDPSPPQGTMGLPGKVDP